MKRIILILAVTVAAFSSCQKETVQPEPSPCPIVQQAEADSCCAYCVILTTDNPDHVFNVFLNNVQVDPGGFIGCAGDTLSMAFQQDCVSFGGCSQFTIDVMKDGALLVGSAAQSESFSQVVILEPCN